jgi:hypothetical protein
MKSEVHTMLCVLDDVPVSRSGPIIHKPWYRNRAEGHTYLNSSIMYRMSVPRTAGSPTEMERVGRTQFAARLPELIYRGLP